ncbi:hypothetical protein [Leptospira jelokensis]|uniref:Uncharacterized protein n=1 Tax=Leptospira jelokensis TaxID=2484931 RepID=A0A4Z1A984_9LEPT|nr:hypothetical protein [Leptospira jelokensis]TGL72222.1 hypothetical protein EHQ62_05165 [Leptospira jelokensis]
MNKPDPVAWMDHIEDRFYDPIKNLNMLFKELNEAFEIVLKPELALAESVEWNSEFTSGTLKFAMNEMSALCKWRITFKERMDGFIALYQYDDRVKKQIAGLMKSYKAEIIGLEAKLNLMKQFFNDPKFHTLVERDQLDKERNFEIVRDNLPGLEQDLTDLKIYLGEIVKDWIYD